MNFKATLARRFARRHAGSGRCGGDDSASASGSDSNTLNVVGYSVLEQANAGVISAFQDTDAGKDVEFKESYGASGDQARAVIAGPGRRRGPPLARARRPEAGRRGHRGGRLEGQRHQGHLHPVRRGHGRAHRQPQGHRLLGRPDQAGRRHRDAQPRLLRLRQVEPARGVRRRARRRRHRRGRPGVPREVLRQRRRPARQRSGRHHRLHQRHRRRAALLRERGDPGPPERHRLRLRDPGLDAADPEPVRDSPTARPTRPRRSWTSRSPPTARSSTPRRATARSSTWATSRCRVRTTRATRSPSRETLLTIDDDFGGWADANTKYFDEDAGIITQIQAEAGE